MAGESTKIQIVHFRLPSILDHFSKYYVGSLLQGVKIYSVQCTSTLGLNLRNEATGFWKSLSTKGHGHYLALERFGTIVDMFMAICFREAGTEYIEVRRIGLKISQNCTLS